MTDLNAYLAQKRTALDGRRARIGRGEVGAVALKAEATVEGRSGVQRLVDLAAGRAVRASEPEPLAVPPRTGC